MNPLHPVLALLPGGAANLPEASTHSLALALNLMREAGANQWLRADGLNGFAGQIAAELAKRYLDEGKKEHAAAAAGLGILADPDNRELTALYIQAGGLPKQRRPASGKLKITAGLASSALIAALAIVGFQLTINDPPPPVAASQTEAVDDTPRCFRISSPLYPTDLDQTCTPEQTKAAATAALGCDPALITVLHPSCPTPRSDAYCDDITGSTVLHPCIPRQGAANQTKSGTRS